MLHAYFNYYIALGPTLLGWHIYKNGYDRVKNLFILNLIKVIQNFCNKIFVWDHLKTLLLKDFHKQDIAVSNHVLDCCFRYVDAYC